MLPLDYEPSGRASHWEGIIPVSAVLQVLRGLRIVFFCTLAGAALAAAWRAQWEAAVSIDDRSWIIDLPRAPLWAGPAVPAYSAFAEFPDLPPLRPAGATIQRSLRFDWMMQDFMLWLWGLCMGCGLLYLMLRDGRRDWILHEALAIGIGLTISAGACVGLWMVFGGWGPPAPLVFGITGLLAGLIVGAAKYESEPLVLWRDRKAS